MANESRFAGLSDKQVHDILTEIACTADLLSTICAERGERFGDHASGTEFLALDMMVRSIGALADLPTGGAFCGDFGAWMVGPLFHTPLPEHNVEAQQ